ncbi:hypothetical protein KBB68_00955 [Candidatus Babeliales bacterium]|nr:hypothetical protein [Candidatus Babeliales bacterium]
MTIKTAQQSTLSTLTKHRIGVDSNIDYRKISNDELTQLKTTFTRKYRMSDYQEKSYDTEIRKINNELINRQIQELIIHVRKFC